MTAYTVTARKDGRWWVVQCVEQPGAISQVTRLDQAADHIREAISFVTDAPETDISVTVRPVVDPAISARLTEMQQQRDAARHAERVAAELQRQAAEELRTSGLTMRDIGEILGVSYQRAHQLTSHVVR